LYHLKKKILIMKPIMKFLLAATLVLAVTAIPSKQAGAQIVRQATISAAEDTLVNATTTTVVITLDGSFKSVEGLLTKVSGTVAGTIKFQGQTLDGGSWEDITSFTLTDVASQFKMFAVPSPRLHKAYRVLFTTTGTQVSVPKVYTCRYTGG
jgi:hypothetical protein